MKTKLLNEWKKVSLSEILDELENGSRPIGGIKEINQGVPSLGGEHLVNNGGFNFDKVRLIPKEFYKKLKKGKIKKYDVLLVKDGATTGKVSIVKENFPFKEAAVNEHLFILRGKKNILDQKFLFYHLFSLIGQRQIKTSFHGAAIGGINTQFVKNYPILLPPLHIQKKIVLILEKAEEVKVLRKEADELTKDFLKAVFFEMFGNPTENRKKWKISTIGENLIAIKYGTGSPPKYTKNGVKFIRATNIKEGRVIENGILFISKGDAKKIEKCKLAIDDLIIVRSGVNTGDCAIITENHSDSYGAYDIILHPDNRILNSTFLNELLYLKSSKLTLKQLSRRTGQPHLNTKQISNFKIILPPIELQNEFASVVKEIDHLKDQQKYSQEQINNLFGNIIQKAFKGEVVC